MSTLSKQIQKTLNGYSGVMGCLIETPTKAYALYHPDTLLDVPQRCQVCRWLVLLMLLFGVATVQAVTTQPQLFDVKPGYASESLKEFARQGGVDIVFNGSKVEEVQTSGVVGELLPRDALKGMLSGTGLVFREDVETGAFAVVHPGKNFPKLPTDQPGGHPGSRTNTNPNQLGETTMQNANSRRGNIIVRVISAALMISSSSVSAQQTDTLDDVIDLNPFVVNATEDEGYVATETLAGTRLKTDLRDIASSISVVTDEFLRDTAAKSNEDLLVYTTSTETGGFFGNFSGVGNLQGAAENLIAPQNNTRIRGLDSADNTRGFFLTDIPWDSYNVDRVEIQRGPNSILFGAGSPAGIINANLVPASFQPGTKIRIQVDEFNSFRTSINHNMELIDDTLAVRVAGLFDDKKFQQKPAFEEDERLYGAISFKPDIFGKNSNTVIRANYEHGEIESNRPRTLPPWDNITHFLSGPDRIDGLNGQVFDPVWAQNYKAVGNGGLAVNINQNPENNQPWLDTAFLFGDGSPVFYFNNGSENPTVHQSYPINTLGLNEDGEQTFDSNGYSIGNITGFISSGSGRYLSLAGYNDYTKNINAEYPDRFPGAARNFYKDKVLTDSSIFNFYDKLIDGNNKREWQEWDAYNVNLSQTFFKGRVGFEAVYDYQEYEQGKEGGVLPRLHVDINAYLGLIPTGYDTGGEEAPANVDPSTVTGGDPNPNVGRAYVMATSQNDSNARTTERENIRLTAFADIRASDFLDGDSMLTKLLGRHLFTGLLSRETYDTYNRSWSSMAVDTSYLESLQLRPSLASRNRSTPTVVYLSDDLRGLSSLSGLGLNGVQSNISLDGDYSMTWFDSTWNATGVDYAAEYFRPLDNSPMTQSENPENYVGVSTRSINVLNARSGDMNDLYFSAFRQREVYDSQAVTWQGYLWNGTIVPTIGWRKDEVITYGTAGLPDTYTDVVNPDFQNLENFDELGNSRTPVTTDAENFTYGLVVHLSDLTGLELPLRTRVSGFYNTSENFRPENRVGFDSMPLPNAQGETEEYGVVFSLLDNRVVFKATNYSTKINNANIQGTPLGSQQAYLYLLESWGAAAALKIQGYWENDPDFNQAHWYANYSWQNDLTAEEKQAITAVTGGNLNLAATKEATRNLPGNVAVQEAAAEFIATMQSQEWYAAYGYSHDISKFQSPDWQVRKTAIPGWNIRQGPALARSSSGGRVNGLTPTGTINQESEGWEFELSAKITKNWNLAINAAKTTARRTDIGERFSSFIEAQYERFQGPAGSFGFQNARALTLREFYEQRVWQPYLFQLDANGEDAPEIRPWRFNLITNYRFTDGWLENFSVGGAYRWQDDIILGYELDDAQERLDHSRPIYGGSESGLDLWLAYGMKLTDGLDWKIQLNVRNVGKSDSLIPVSVNPDGSYATQRIANGMTWFVTNTFSF